MVQIEVHYSGRVQGVGFRFNAQHLARGFQVAGEVRNLSDGRVQLVVQGEKGEVERFLTTISQSMSANIEQESRQEQPPVGTFTGFQIRG